MNIQRKLYVLLGLFLVSIASYAEQAVVIQKKQLSFWNHSHQFPKEFDRLSLAPVDYDMQLTSHDNSLVISTRLVKKITNWHHQHANGIKVSLADADLTFADIKSIHFDFTHLADVSVLPRKASLVKIFERYINQQIVNPVWFDQLLPDSGIVSFVLFGTNYDNPDKKSVMATYQMVLDDNSGNNNRVRLSLLDFNTYSQKNWQETAVPLKSIMHSKVEGLLIMAETKNGKTLRSYLQNKYDEQMVENFIELGVAIKGLTITTR